MKLQTTDMREVTYLTPGGISVRRTQTVLPFSKGLDRFLRQLDQYRGIYLSSGYEFPGRYSRWDIVSVKPPRTARLPARRHLPAS